MLDLPTPVLLLIGTSTLAALWVDVLVWRREDHVLFKLAVTLVSLIPVIGPIAGFWITSFPDKMHPDLQAKYKTAVNNYAVPEEHIRDQVARAAENEGARGP